MLCEKIVLDIFSQSCFLWEVLQHCDWSGVRSEWGFSTESGCTLMTAILAASWEIYQRLQVWCNDFHFLHDNIGIAYIGTDWWVNLGYSLVWIYLKRFNEGEYHARWAKLSHSGQLFWLLSQKSLFRNIGKKTKQSMT